MPRAGPYAGSVTTPPGSAHAAALHLEGPLAVGALALVVERLWGRVAGTGTQVAGDGLRAGGVVVVIDGMTGSGKTALARSLIERMTGRPAPPCRPPLALEGLVPGWECLAEGVGRASALLAALGRGHAGRAPSWDWERMRPGPQLVVPPLDAEVLVVEGCGALAAAAQDLPALQIVRVLVEAPAGLRHRRIAERDPYRWDVRSWERQELQVARRWAAGRWGPGVLVSTESGWE